MLPWCAGELQAMSCGNNWCGSGWQGGGAFDLRHNAVRGQGGAVIYGTHNAVTMTDHMYSKITQR